MQSDPFYDSPKWLRLRKSVLRRDKYQDQEAKRYGKIKPADIVHHIFPKNNFPQYAYEPWNLISVSRVTHNTFHDRETDELTEKGMELLRRTCRKQNIPIPPQYQEKQSKRGTFSRDGYYYD
jgi:5-methylcytosine-specific restriction endonuclease McrA